MTVKKPICLCLALFMLLLLSACNGQPENPDSKGKDKQDSETYQSHSGTGKTDDISVQVPTDAEIQSMLENGEIKILWAVEEDAFSQSAAVSVYNTESVDGDTVWNALFSKEDLISRQQLGGYSKMSITLDGGEYVGQLYDSGLIEFNNLSEFPSALSSEHLMGTLSNFTGMEWILGQPDDAADTSTYYQFSVDGIIIDRNGYSVGEVVYAGPYAMFDSSAVTITIPFRLGSKGDTLAASDFISCEQAKTLCSVDLLAQADFPQIVVFNHSKLVYYYQAQQKMLLPAWRITGTFYGLSGDGALYSGTTVRLIDAQTGELFW